jgi:SAM-dependent methyltransferase
MEIIVNPIVQKVCSAGFRLLAKGESLFDDFFLAKDVPLSKIASHDNYQQYLSDLANREGFRVLEVGSREVTGPSKARQAFSKAEYIGFDFYPGNNVDVVGDAHRLSWYFEQKESFDLIYSSACFEHFAMPWVVATEIAKLLKVGGVVFVETHFSFGSHARPWNFFQFSDMGLRVLFSSALGFECIEAGMSNPMVARFSASADEYLRYKPIHGLFCHSEYLGRKVKHVESIDWASLDPTTVVGETKYPQPTK